MRYKDFQRIFKDSLFGNSADYLVTDKGVRYGLRWRTGITWEISTMVVSSMNSILYKIGYFQNPESYAVKYRIHCM